MIQVNVNVMTPLTRELKWCAENQIKINTKK